MTIIYIVIFSISVVPSTSHTVCLIRSAKTFVESLPHIPATVHTELRGSLSATGKGHSTDRAVILGLAGWTPLTVPVDAEPRAGSLIAREGSISGPAGSMNYSIAFNNKP